MESHDYFSGHYGVYPLRFNRHSFLFGPKISSRHEKFTPFAQALFGGAHDEDPNNSVTAFAWTTGGGVDLSVSKHFAARLIQIEYARATSRRLAESNVSISVASSTRAIPPENHSPVGASERDEYVRCHSEFGRFRHPSQSTV